VNTKVTVLETPPLRVLSGLKMFSDGLQAFSYLEQLPPQLSARLSKSESGGWSVSYRTRENPMTPPLTRQSLIEAKKYIETAMAELHKVRLFDASTAQKKAECNIEYDRAFVTIGRLFSDAALRAQVK
jgi:hypothetical protein